MSNANEPAFPVEYGEGMLMLKAGQQPRGLTKREYFAAKAMQGFLIHYSGYTECNFATEPRETAERAVEYADALLAELAKGEK